MTRIAGIDGCRSGWFVVTATMGLDEPVWFTAASIEEASARLHDCAVIGIDIPIGLTDAGARQCDLLARKLLAPGRTSSVFPAPNRPLLGLRDYRAACDMRESIDGRRISVQAFNILPRIDEVDRYVRSIGHERSRLCEVHPELAFAALNEGSAMRYPKRKAGGFKERLSCLAGIFGKRELQAALSAYPRAEVQKDDVLDAFAVLHSAARIAAGQAGRVPAERARDSEGIDMAIWF